MFMLTSQFWLRRLVYSFHSDVKEWIDKQKFKLVHKTKCEYNLWSDNFEHIEYQLHFHVELYQNGFNQRRYKIVDSNYHTCWFASNEHTHSYIKEFIKPWVAGREVKGLPVKTIIH